MYQVTAVSEGLHAISWRRGVLGRLVMFSPNHVSLSSCRQMSHAVYEEEYLGNFPKTETFTDAEVPLPLPDRAADHQGLYLSTDGDQLLGRADNGISG